MRRLLLAALAATSLLTGCGSSSDPVPAITPDMQAELTVEALATACDSHCDREGVFIYDMLFKAATVSGNEARMPTAVRTAIADNYPNATFVEVDAADTLFGDDGLVAAGQGVLISIGPADELKDNVVGIDVGIVTARDGGYWQTIQFLWNGTRWEQADGDETGVTVTSSVS